MGQLDTRMFANTHIIWMTTIFGHHKSKKGDNVYDAHMEIHELMNCFDITYVRTFTRLTQHFNYKHESSRVLKPVLATSGKIHR